MNNHQPTPLPDPTAARLVLELNTLRDALVHLSMLMRDFQFEVDSSRREMATQQTSEILEQAKTVASRAPDNRH